MFEVAQEADVFVFRDFKMTPIFFLYLNIKLFDRKTQTRLDRTSLKRFGADWPAFELSLKHTRSDG